MKALIVDDNATNRIVLEHYLTAAGMPHVSVASACAGLETARSAAAGSAPFDLILLDYQMPEIDGLGFIARLKADERIAHIPCVIISSLGDRPAVPEAGNVAAWLSKPVRRAALLRVLATIAGRASIHPAPVRGAGEKLDLSGVRVLLAEDNIVNQKVALRALGTLGINAELATNGEEALARVKSKTFDAILMDCQMPVMDGYEATRAIREWERASAQPRVTIIAMTANALASDRARCLDVGMDDHLAKPFKRDELGATLAKWLEPAGGGGYQRSSR